MPNNAQIELKGVIPSKYTSAEALVEAIRELREFVRQFSGLGEEVMRTRGKNGGTAMHTQVFRTVIHAKQLQPIFNIPEGLAEQLVEVIVRLMPQKTFRSIQRIKIDTCLFKFNREEANAR